MSSVSRLFVDHILCFITIWKKIVSLSQDQPKIKSVFKTTFCKIKIKTNFFWENKFFLERILIVSFIPSWPLIKKVKWIITKYWDLLWTLADQNTVSELKSARAHWQRSGFISFYIFTDNIKKGNTQICTVELLSLIHKYSKC